MWSQLFLCALIGFAAASSNGYQQNKEYVYKVHGRTVAGLHDVANKYTGIDMKARLAIRPQEDGSLTAKIFNAKYSQVNQQLDDGWKTEIPEDQLQYKNFRLSEKPFQIKMQHGVVHQLVVDSELENWEANMIKSIVSQIQLDTQAQNLVESHMNQLPEENSYNAVFKTMEDTVTGEYETIYDIAPLPEHVLADQPWIAPMPEVQGEAQLIEIVKNKNFSSAEERPAYYHGFGDMGDFEPATNQMADFLLRNSMSRAIISGNLKNYIIQSTFTTNKVILSPTLNSDESGMVVSYLNLTLHDVSKCSGSFEIPQPHTKLGSLVYSFNAPFDQSRNVRERTQGSSTTERYSEEEVYTRHPRSLGKYVSESSEEWTQDEAPLSQPPNSPLLPLYIGYKGQSVKNSEKVDIVKSAEKIAQQIGQEISHPDSIPKQQTLAKYVILSTIARIMSEKEMQTVAQQLYTQKQEGPEAQAWFAYRDAVAESGTGPALLTIQAWIKNKKIESEEAAEVIASMADSARQPTEEYMRTFHQLVNDEHVQRQALLNDTALLSYTSLIRKVYIDREYAHSEYPEHSFGQFDSQKAQKFVEDTLIPQLKEQLDKAVKHADSHKVLVYIRALGNVAHQNILQAFEPYLEGKKQCSQFQRLQMVVALDKLVQVEPKIARSVLYKIYQNQGEQQEVRVAAVYQLMRCGPSSAMLQRMAKYTSQDTDEQVNAAVKSAIESAAELDTDSELAENARAALPLLTTQEYGIQYSAAYLRDYVQQEMNLAYKQRAHVYGSQDSAFPKGIKYALHAGLGGAKRQLVNVRAMVSSIDELTNVLERQTEQYNKDNEQHKSYYQQSEKNQWSPEHIAKLLKIENIEREQLEGSMLLQLAGGVTRYFTFNNETIDALPQALEQYEQELREGKQFQYTKFLNRYESSIAFPMEMGVPFMYTLDAPTLMHVKGQIRAVAEPKAIHQEALRRPDTIRAETEIHAVVSTKVQAKLAFVTPHDNQQYLAGYDKNIQVQIPIKSKIEIDLKQGEIQAQVQPIKSDKNVHLFHYSTWPYVSQKNVFRMEPVALNEKTEILYSEQGLQSQWQGVVGKEAGLAIRVEYASEQKFLDSQWAYEQYQRNDIISAFLAPLYDESIMHTKLDVYYDADHSTAHQVQIRAGYKHLSENGKIDGQKPELSRFSQLPKESSARREQFAKMAASGIQSVEAQAIDAEIQFEGPKKVQYRALIAQAMSPADSKVRVLAHLSKKSATQQVRPWELFVKAEADVPATNRLDFNSALKYDPTIKAHVEIALGKDYESAAKMNLRAKFEQSESRRQYLKHHPRAQECREEMQEGNNQLPACANMTQEANLLDRVHLQVQYDNLSAPCRNATKKMYNALRYLAFYHLEENMENATGTQNENELDVKIRFEPDFESANVTLKAYRLDAHMDNIRINSWAKQIVAVHPDFSLRSRVMSEAFGYDTYRPYCIVDKTAANTFDNKTYPLDLENDWTVMFQYVPDYARTGDNEESYNQQQKQYQNEQYSVLVRESKKGEKEVKMMIRTPETNGRLVEIELKQNNDVQVNKKQYQVTEQKTTDIEDGAVQIYLLDQDVMVDVQDFYVIYDGERVKIAPRHDKFRDASRGLCGTYTGQESDDFLTPEQCIAVDSKDFVRSYSLAHSGNRKYKSPCYEQEQVYANVISDRDAGREQHHHHHSNKHHQHRSGEDSCTKHQTRYVEQDDQICFTTRPMPVCKQSCQEGELVQKRVPVHCVQKTNVAQLWKKQIQNGGSPDFSKKTPTDSLMIEVPQSCSK